MFYTFLIMMVITLISSIICSQLAKENPVGGHAVHWIIGFVTGIVNMLIYNGFAK